MNRSRDDPFTTGMNRKRQANRTTIKASRSADLVFSYPKASPLPLGAVLPHQLVRLLDAPVAVDHHGLLVPSVLGRLLLRLLRRRCCRGRGGGGRRGHESPHNRRDAVGASEQCGPRGRRGEDARAGVAEEDGSGHPGAHRRRSPVFASQKCFWGAGADAT